MVQLLLLFSRHFFSWFDHSEIMNRIDVSRLPVLLRLPSIGQKPCFDKMEAHTFVIIDRWVKCRLFTIPLNTIDDGITVGLPQALGQDESRWVETSQDKLSWVKPSRVETSWVELRRVELRRVELVQVETSQVESSWDELSQDETKRVKSSRVESSRVETR